MLTIAQVKKIGVQAYRDGKGRAPAANPAFPMSEACKSGQLIEMLDAYTAGWTYAQLAENAIPGSPSIAALAEIEAA